MSEILNDKTKKTAETKPENKFEVQRLYVKEKQCKLSRSPHIFKEEWKPEIQMEVQTKNEKLEDNIFEVQLQINITAKNKQITAFTAEVVQAGIFRVEGFKEEQQKRLLQAYSADILFPYVRKVIADMSVEATLPPILLQPINFDSIYLQQQAKNKQESSKDGDAVISGSDTTH